MFRQSFPTIAQPSMERIVSESRASICALCSGMTHRAGCHPASTDRRACVTSTHRAHSPPVQHSKANELGRRLMCRTRSGNSETTLCNSGFNNSSRAAAAFSTFTPYTRRTNSCPGSSSGSAAPRTTTLQGAPPALQFSRTRWYTPAQRRTRSP